jgi:uncharacterized repeat protein (TIGR03843 family)
MYVLGQMDIDDADAPLLQGADITIEGQLASASNTTLRGVITREDGSTFRCVYKPAGGERPLWDFHEGTLGRREVATYELSQALGLNVVPLTVWREDGPFGPGMCQRWIEVDHARLDVDLFPEGAVPDTHMVILKAQDEVGNIVALGHSQSHDVRSVAFLDVLTNNADRKAGHLMRDAGNRLWAIDHGVTFHHEPKLRTVLWGWSGTSLNDHISKTVSLAGQLQSVLTPWLSDEEIQAFNTRMNQLQESPNFPDPPSDRPAVPWPVF